jgi:uncharacterized protein YndB with AHSA1/START domain
MTELGTITAGTARLERVYPVDVDTLWTYLTAPEGLSRWMADGEIGADGVHLVFHDNPDDPINGKTLVWDPPQVAEFEWTGGPTQRTGSVVRFEVTAVPGGARLVLTHTRNARPGSAADFAAGWHFHLDTLDALIAGVEAPADRATWDELSKHYQEL